MAESAPGLVRTVPQGVRVAVRLTPRAARDAVRGLAATPDGGTVLKVSVTAVPEAGKANEALVRLLARAWGVPPTSLSIVSGAADRNKVLEVAGEPEALRARITAWLPAAATAR